MIIIIITIIVISILLGLRILLLRWFFKCVYFNYFINNLEFMSLEDMQQYESAMSWKAHDGEVYSVEFSYDENTVFSIGEDGKVGVQQKTPFSLEN